MNPFNSLRNIYNQYPRQYWLMITGIVLATAGGSMIWPFLIIYASGKLDLPLSTVAALISINAGTGLISSLVAGTLADKVGRKVVMNFSLTVNGLAYFMLMRAETYPQFAGLMMLVGLSNPLYQVGADAMLADMIPSEKRTDAYAINRMANNAAFALGPAIGGFLATRSYDLAFYCAGIGFLSYSVLLFFMARETLVIAPRAEATPSGLAEVIHSYSGIVRDKGFMGFVLALSIGLIAPTLLWILMPIYSKTHFGIPENLYGWIPTTNALMCVFVQYPVTSITRRYPTLSVLTVGMLIYALGAGSVALMSGFWGFWLSMVILTFGELTLVPTASKYVADLAPAELRGRYMSLHWLGWGLARTLSPLIGGFLNDNIAPQAIWVGGLLVGLTSTLGLLLLSRGSTPRSALQTGP
jgi:MFS family permease